MNDGPGTAPEPGAGSGSGAGKVPEAAQEAAPEQWTPPPATAPDPRPATAPATRPDAVPEQRTTPPEKPGAAALPAEKGAPPELRIGHAERAAALAALDEHFEAGRLDVTEYGERSGVAGAAVVASELTGLFSDLPAPHPDLPGRPAPSSSPAPGTPEAWDAVATRRDQPPARPWADTVALALPVLLIAAMIVLVVVFENPGAFALFPFVFILAHRFGPRRRR